MVMSIYQLSALRRLLVTHHKSILYDFVSFSDSFSLHLWLFQHFVRISRQHFPVAAAPASPLGEKIDHAPKTNKRSSAFCVLETLQGRYRVRREDPDNYNRIKVSQLCLRGNLFFIILKSLYTQNVLSVLFF